MEWNGKMLRMESQPPLAPVAELQYQSELSIPAIHVVRLIAMWCVIIGVIAALEFAIELIDAPAVRQLLINRISPSDALGIVIVLATTASNVVLLICGVMILQGR